jgi:hypothetical protein
MTALLNARGMRVGDRFDEPGEHNLDADGDYWSASTQTDPVTRL